jgi:hypothetical protein
MMATKNPFQGDDLDFFAAARDESGEIKKETPKAEAPKAAAEPAKKQTFGQAFAAARRAGDKTFMFGGKSFSTAMASDKAKPAAKAPATRALPSADRVGPTKARAAAMAKPEPKAEAPKPAAKPKTTAKAEMQRNTASNAAANRERLEARAKANRERMEAQRKSKDTESKSMFGRNPKGMTPEELRKSKETKMAKGGSVRGAGIEKRGMRKCKIV